MDILLTSKGSGVVCEKFDIFDIRERIEVLQNQIICIINVYFQTLLLVSIFSTILLVLIQH